MLLSELEEIDEEYRNLRYADGLLYSCWKNFSRFSWWNFSIWAYRSNARS
jgi:hypothetical protein